MNLDAKMKVLPMVLLTFLFRLLALMVQAASVMGFVRAEGVSSNWPVSLKFLGASPP